MITARKIELLAPAKNADYGIEAILHGADAVYIGAPRFSARASAGNTVGDIARLSAFAHQYYAKVYVALNTILEDSDMKATEELIHELYCAGADALIIQDMGILQLNLPPIPLHASTQMDNRTVEKIVFLEKAGFSQIVLARELSVEEIARMASAVSTPLEAFIHGALCVSFSGQCYLSSALNGRSANRGTCSQPCRLPYNLVDSEGKTVTSGKHLLSMKDLNQSENLEELLEAGVSSLKIEGRLKDLSYVKNTVAYYRRKIDNILALHPEWIRASSGESRFAFTPDLKKTFNRGYTEYFLHKRDGKVGSPDSPKSIGEFAGVIREVTTRYLRIETKVKLHNGDGLCFLNHKNELEGIHVNRVEGDLIYPLQLPVIKKGTVVYRNNDHEFEKILSKKTAERKLSVRMELSERADGYLLKAEDEDGCLAELCFPMEKQQAQKDQTENIRNNLSKTGQTIFQVTNVDILFSEDLFIPASILSQWRREIIDKLLQERIDNYPREQKEHLKTSHAFPERNITYLGNVANSYAKTFYEQHQAKVVQPAFEISKQADVPLMFTRHCIKYSMGWCPKERNEKHPFSEPFFLEYENTRLRLLFDCKNCQMKVYKE
ncbi:MAG: U32 family peptidase [Dysgonamonadaceae bacterium]